jgi:hypothetical protein
VRRAARALATTTPPRAQPPLTLPRPQPTQPRTAPAPQHASATARAQQAAGGEVRLDHSTVVCDDQHDVLQWRHEAPSSHRIKVSAKGASINRITIILSPPPPQRRPASPPRVTPDHLAVTTQRVAQHRHADREVKWQRWWF